LSLFFWYILVKEDNEIDKQIELYNSDSDEFDAEVLSIVKSDSVKYNIKIFMKDDTIKAQSVGYVDVFGKISVGDIVSVKFFRERNGLYRAVIIDNDLIQEYNGSGLASMFGWIAFLLIVMSICMLGRYIFCILWVM